MSEAQKDALDDLIFDVEVYKLSEWHKAGVRVDVCDDDRMREALDYGEKLEYFIFDEPDEGESWNTWDGPYLYVLEEGTKVTEMWDIDRDTILFKCSCNSSNGVKVLTKLKSAFEGIFTGNCQEDNEEPLFNIYFSTDIEESGDPEYKDQTLEQCKKICEDAYDKFLKGTLNPWGWGTLDPDEDNLDIMCYCSNGLTEDEFGLLSYGKNAGEFIDYPRGAPWR